MVDQLKALAAAPGPGRLIAIAGMGVSTTPTQSMARQLGANGAGIPMFGAVTTGDSLDRSTDPDLFRVVPSVKQQLQVLIPFLKRHRQPLAPVHGKQPQIAVVEDANTSDLYKNSLYEDFKAELPGLPEDAYHPYSYVPGGLAPGGQFASITADLCQRSPLPVVLYDGRESVLGQFIQQLDDDSDCQGEPITIITGGDADALPASLTNDTQGGANVRPSAPGHPHH